MSGDEEGRHPAPGTRQAATSCSTEQGAAQHGHGPHMGYCHSVQLAPGGVLCRAVRPTRCCLGWRPATGGRGAERPAASIIIHRVLGPGAGGRGLRATTILSPYARRWFNTFRPSVRRWRGGPGLPLGCASGWGEGGGDGGGRPLLRLTQGQRAQHRVRECGPGPWERGEMLPEISSSNNKISLHYSCLKCADSPRSKYLGNLEFTKRN